LTLFAIELALRIYHGKILHFDSLIEKPQMVGRARLIIRS
jgi:hypothetical protein